MHLTELVMYLIYSVEGKGAFRLSMSGFSFLSLSTVSSASRAQEIITHQRQSIEERVLSKTLPLGLEEQYKVLLKTYKDGYGGECEIILFPGWLGLGCSYILVKI